MANKMETLVSTTDTSGSVTFKPQDATRWTARIVAPGQTFNYGVKVAVTSAEDSSAGYGIATGTAKTDELLNNETGTGASLQVYEVYITWNSLNGGTISIFLNMVDD